MSNHQKKIGENPSIGLRSNFLVVDDTNLRADVLKNSRSEKATISHSELEGILVLGRTAILQGIEDFYKYQVEMNPDLKIVRPSIWTVHLGTTSQTDGFKSKVFTQKGYDNGGVVRSIDEVKPEFHKYWNAITDTGFTPEIRRTSGKKDGGSWLLFRKPELKDVLDNWFGYSSKFLDEAIEFVRHEDKSCERENLRDYRKASESMSSQVFEGRRSKYQIGVMLSTAAIKMAIGDYAGYEDEIDDALEKAYSDSRIEDGVIRAIENSTFQSLKS